MFLGKFGPPMQIERQRGLALDRLNANRIKNGCLWHGNPERKALNHAFKWSRAAFARSARTMLRLLKRHGMDLPVWKTGLDP